MTWILIRTTGFVAYAFLSAAAIWGLLVSTKILGRNASPKSMTYVHESLSMAAILATIGHLGFLYLDDFVEFGPRELLVPGASGWRPTAVALGIFAFYGLVVITASFYVRTRIGQRRWRLLHFASFGVFVSALAHGITAGSDTGTLFATVLYSASATAVLFLVVLRGFLVRAASSAPATRRQPAGTRHPVATPEPPAPAQEHAAKPLTSHTLDPTANGGGAAGL